MKIAESRSKTISNLIIFLFTTFVGELVKKLINNPDFDIYITILFFAAALGLFALIDFLITKRLSDGKTVNSIAIRSSIFINKYYRSVRKTVREGKWESKEENIIRTLNSISHQLLLVGEYNIRLHLGKIIAKNTKDPLLKIQAMMDEIGWTLVLMGRKKSIQFFKDAMKLTGFDFPAYDMASQIIGKLNNDHAKEMAYLASRACRHLASTSFLKLKERLEWSQKGLLLIENLEACEKLPPHLDASRLVEMRTGLEYGLGLIHLSYVVEDNTTPPELVTFDHLIKAARYNGLAKKKAATFSNKHRYLKTLLVENEIFNATNKVQFSDKDRLPAPADQEAQDWLLAMNKFQFNVNLETAETILKTSIYVDEAFEIYLEERLRGEKEES